MIRSFLFFSALVLVSSAIFADDAQPDAVRIVGSSIVVKPLSLAEPILRERGFHVKVSMESGSGAAITAAGEGDVDIALSTRPINAEDRASYPAKLFHQSVFGIEALALIVRKDVWESGVRALSRKQLREIYEREVTNWKQLGGADLPIKFYNPAQGHGVWEFLAIWLYGEQRKAPLGESFDPAADTEEARNSVEFNAGALSIAPPNVVDQKSIFALSVRDEAGEAVEPTVSNIRSGRYPFQRSLYLVTPGRPAGKIKKIIEFMLSPEGQALVEKCELISPGPP